MNWRFRGANCTGIIELNAKPAFILAERVPVLEGCAYICLLEKMCMSELLFQKFIEKVSLTDRELEACRAFFISKKLRKRQYLLQEGDVCKHIAFVEKGFLKSYTIDGKGTEHVIQFAFEGWWIGDQLSFLTGEPSIYTIDALEDSEVLLLSHEAQEKMLAAIPKFERYFRILLQNNLIAIQRRLVSSLSHTAEEKYKSLLANYPDIAQRVPQHLIASFLGITPETLSRIKKQIALRK
jgi:CRP-like cAMP-binding protein